ncbi:MAG: endonuclease/exonuclease/phosphatase family protein [Lewinella sp.]|nr:endonuclease/exonuclease/phosphatase family protein [Lewinella sp.]
MLHLTDTPPPIIQQEMQALSDVLDRQIPPKILDRNLLIATWNIRAMSDITPKWVAGEDDSPARDLHALLGIAHIIERFDVVAIQEVRGKLEAFNQLMDWLGEYWSFILTDVTKGASGNGERMAFIFDTRRVRLSGLAGELVVPKEELGGIGSDALQEQFARTPYAVSFRADQTTFILVTLHILYGDDAQARIPELKKIAEWLADWAKDGNAFHRNFIALGDFNIDERGDLLHQTFVSEGLFIPEDLAAVTRSIFDEDKFYDHIAWFAGANRTPKLTMEYLQGGNFDFVPHLLTRRGLTKRKMSWMISDHYPLWAEFSLRD